MRSTKQKKEVQKRSVETKPKEKEKAVGPLKSPPPFQLSASQEKKKDKDPLPLRTEQKAKKDKNKNKVVQSKTANGKEPKPLKDNAKDVEYGPARDGEIASKGKGDTEAIMPKDVNQGALGDCWLLSSLMTLAKSNPQAIRDAITGPLSDGSYNVRLFKKKGRGKRASFEAETINVTSSFVTWKTGGYEAYAHGGDTDKNGNEELWVKLIEKAYAKWKGSFAKIDGGWEENALEALTGKNFESTSFNGGLFGIGKMSDADLKKEIIDGLGAGNPMTASTKSDSEINKADKDEGGFAKQNDIVGRHAYAVLEANSKGVRLRNPWGSGASNPEPFLTWKQFRKYYRDITTTTK